MTSRLLDRRFAVIGLFLAWSAGAQVNLEIGDLYLSPSLFASSGVLVQVPVFLEDLESLEGLAGNGIREIILTLQVTGDTNVIVGGASANVTVANAFIGTALDEFAPGIRDPGVDLVNSNGVPTPTGSPIYNQVTPEGGGGAGVDFPLGDLTIGGNWIINNQFAGDLKRAAVSSSTPGLVIGTTTVEKMLVAVIEFEIEAGLDGQPAARIEVSTNNDVVGYNAIAFDDPGPGDTILLLLSSPPGYEGVISLEGMIFVDGFESGNLTAWSSQVP